MNCLKAQFALSAFCAMALACLAQPAHASQWTDIATISSTLGNNAGYLCVGGGSTDLGCPTTAPYVDPSTGYIGIGTTAPIAPLQITSSTYTNNVYIGDNLDGFGSGGINAGGAIYFGASYAPGISSTTAGIEASWSGGTLPQISIGTLRQNLPTFARFDYIGRIHFFSYDNELMTLVPGKVGVSTTSPRTTLDVSGTLKIADGGESCSTTILGAVKYTSGAFYICQNATNGWEQISTSGGAVTTDHIVSSTTSVYANSNGTISLTTSGNTYSNITSNGTLNVSKTTNTALINRITNSSSGTTAYAGFWAGNSNSVTAFGTGGVSYTSFPLVANRGFMDSNAALDGLVLQTEGIGDPILFSTHGIERMRITDNGIGIGTSTPSAPLEISGTTFAPTDIDQGNVGIGSVNASGWAGVGIVFSNSTSSSTVLNRDIVQNGGNLYFGRHTSSTNILDMTITSNGQVAIRGTLKIADGGETCSAATLGAVKYASGAFYICQNAATGWEQISTSGATTSDHIASSTTSIYANSTGYISLTTGGTTTGYFDTSGLLVVPGISATGTISGTTGSFNSGYLGSLSVTANALGTSAGNATTLVSALQSDTNSDYLNLIHRRYTAGSDWTSANYRLQRKVDITSMGFIDFGIDGAVGGSGLGFGSGATTDMVINNHKVGIGTTAPATALEVSGTVSATYFVGDGSGLTGISTGDNLGNHTATQNLVMGTNKITFGSTMDDKEYYYSNSYGRGIESGTLTDWSGANFRWRIGGTSASTGTQYMLLSSSGLTVAAPVISTDANGMRIVQGNYGTFWRNDGSTLYLMLTNSGDQYGTWNSLRPFVVNLASGTVTLADTTISGTLNMGSNAITSSAGTIRDGGGGWVRTYGNTGWYNATYGGGTYMTDSNYVRNYNNKGIYSTTTSLNAVTGDSSTGYGVVGKSGSSYGVFGQSGTAGIGGVIGYSQDSTVYGILGHANAYSLYGNGTVRTTADIAAGTTITAGSTITAAGVINANGGVTVDGNSIINGSSGATVNAYYTDNTHYGYFAGYNGSGQRGFYLGWGDGGSTVNLTMDVATTLAISGNTTVTGSVTAASYYQSSDARLKTNIQTSSGLAVIDKLRGVTFNWKKDGKPSAGVIAQEVEKVLPAAVATDDKGMKSVNYQELMAPLIESVKELHKQVSQLQADNASLQAEVEQLRKGR